MPASITLKMSCYAGLTSFMKNLYEGVVLVAVSLHCSQ